MRIGIFVDQYYPNISGVVTSVNMLSEGLRKLGHEVFIFTSFDEKTLTNEQLLNIDNNVVINLPGISYPFKQLKDYRFSLKKRKIVKTIELYNLDIIHVQTEFNISKIAIAASKKLHIPIVYTLHTMYEEYLEYLSPFFDKHFHNKMFNLLGKLFMKPISDASVIKIVPTKKVYNVANSYMVTGDIRIVPSGIDLSKFDSKKYTKEEILDLKKEIGIPEDKFIFGFIGRASSEKRIDVLINAFANMKYNENCVLLIIGGGPQLEELKELAAKSKAADKIYFTGFIPIESIAKYYQLYDIFVNASKSETQGLTYIEALASSIPLLVQKDDCLIDVVEDYYNGIYFDGVDDLCSKMDEVQKVKTTLKKIKSNTTKSVKKYSKDIFVKTIESIYIEAVELYNKK